MATIVKQRNRRCAREGKGKGDARAWHDRFNPLVSTFRDESGGDLQVVLCARAAWRSTCVARVRGDGRSVCFRTNGPCAVVLRFGVPRALVTRKHPEFRMLPPMDIRRRNLKGTGYAGKQQGTTAKASDATIRIRRPGCCCCRSAPAERCRGRPTGPAR